MVKQLTMEDAVVALTTDLLILALDEQLAKLARTPLSRQTLKVRLGQLRTELGKDMTVINSLFEVNADDMSELYTRASELVPKIFSLRPEDWQTVEAVLSTCQHTNTLKYRQLLAVLAQPNK